MNPLPLTVERDVKDRSLRISSYVMAIEPVAADGGWSYRASYPELDGVEVVRPTVLSAIDDVDALKEEFLVRHIDAPPRPSWTCRLPVRVAR